MKQELVPHAPPNASRPVQQFTFSDMQRMASAFAKSGIYGVKDENQALALLLEAHAMGKHPGMVIKDYYIGPGNKVGKYATAMLRDFQASGGRVEWLELSDTKASAVFTHPLAPKPLTIDWDMERAKRAGLSGKDGSMYSKYARSMLRSRCLAEGIRSTAPEATEGKYTPEEMREIERDVEAQETEAAVADATKDAQATLTDDEMGELILALDVKTRPELAAAFNTGWKRVREAGTEAQQRKYRDWRDQMLSVIESGDV